MAHSARAYISAAFTFGMKSEHDYTRQERAERWGIRANPVAAIPVDPQALRVGHRFLMPMEFRLFWAWLEENHTRRSEEHTSELQSLMRNSYAVFCLKKNKN